MVLNLERIRLYMERIKQRNKSLSWAGPQQPSTVRTAESILGLRLPLSYTAFLLSFGAGGIKGDEISGLREDNPFLHGEGNVCADTIRWRGEIGMPDHLILVHATEDELGYCLDSSSPDAEGEYPVVAYDPDLPRSAAPRVVFASFGEFLLEYLRDHSERARLE
jgi:hypothetical protein